MKIRKDWPKLIADFYELRVEQLMDKKIWDIPLIEKDAPLVNVLSILDGKSHVWVVENKEEKKILGVITRHDVLNILLPPRAQYDVFSVPKFRHHDISGRAENVMTRDPVTCKPDQKILEVLQKMIRHRVRRLPVVTSDSKITGEITLKHLIHKYYLASQYYKIVEDEK